MIIISFILLLIIPIIMKFYFDKGNNMTIILMILMFGIMVGALYAAYILYTLGAGIAVVIPCLIAIACGIFIVHDFLRLKDNK